MKSRVFRGMLLMVCAPLLASACSTTVISAGYPPDGTVVNATISGDRALRPAGAERLRVAVVNVKPFDYSWLSSTDRMIARVPVFVTLLQAAGHDAYYFSENDPPDVSQYDVIMRYRIYDARWREEGPLAFLTLFTLGLWPTCTEFGSIREVVLRVPGGEATHFETRQHRSRCYGWFPWAYRTARLKHKTGDWLEASFYPADANANPEGEADWLARAIISGTFRLRQSSSR